jgi:serine/threonine protein kinase
MGIVYLAHQIDLERPVALKVIRPELAHDPHFRARFRSESRTAASIEHPRVVTVFGAGELDGLLYVAMRYVAGDDLGRLLAAGGPLPAESAAELTAQVADGLDAVHAAGLVHRDVKPANVIVEETGGGPAAYLTDFGLAKAAAATDGLTATGELIGSVDYMAPEQIEGRRIDARTDVYALGCVLFHAVSGRVPFPDRESSAKMWAHLNEPPPPAGSGNRGTPRALDRVIQRALAKDAARRFPSAGDLGRAALAAVHGEAVTEPERAVGSGEAAAAETLPIATEIAPARTDRLPRRRKRRWRRRLLAGLIALVVLAGLGAAAIIEVPRLTDNGSSPSKASGVTIPDLSGQPLDAAERRLRDLGLEPSEVSDSIFGVLVPADWDVCRTDPAPGRVVRPHSTVRLLVDRPDVC